MALRARGRRAAAKLRLKPKLQLKYQARRRAVSQIGRRAGWQARRRPQRRRIVCLVCLARLVCRPDGRRLGGHTRAIGRIWPSFRANCALVRAPHGQRRGLGAGNWMAARIIDRPDAAGFWRRMQQAAGGGRRARSGRRAACVVPCSLCSRRRVARSPPTRPTDWGRPQPSRPNGLGGVPAPVAAPLPAAWAPRMQTCVGPAPPTRPPVVPVDVAVGVKGGKLFRRIILPNCHWGAHNGGRPD